MDKHCETFRKHFLDHILGDSDSASSEKLLDHLSQCESCAAEYRLISAGWETSREELNSASLSPFFNTRLMQNLLSDDNVTVTRIPSLLKRILQPVAIAALLVVGIFIGVRISDAIHPDVAPAASGNGNAIMISVLAGEYMPEDSPEDVYTAYSQNQ